MSFLWLALTLFAMAAVGFFIGRFKALRSAGNNIRMLHSLPSYYGTHVALMVLVPAFVVFGAWSAIQPNVINATVSASVPESAIPEGATRGLIMSEVRRVADGLDLVIAEGTMTAKSVNNLRAEFSDVRARLAEVGVALGSDVSRDVLKAAQSYRVRNYYATIGMTVVVLVLAIGGFGISVARTNKDLRARNIVEKAILALLLASASIAILTTVGIVLSMLFETRNFLGLHSWTDFFFGATWAPNFRGDSELSILPLLWGTLYISFVALLVAVPVGLFAAIYLSEYASRAVRSFAKPLLEILAGIPTIVYGLFALVTFGPFLLDIFGNGGVLGVNWMTDARAVVTAGVAMGIMLIPFVSSLSDDIINAVPQAMRDGSYGLGATKSETIKKVVFPAALPGIVGAILLATSRAIGETMIVVMGAGAIARFSGNPFEAMTTITTRIVSQLTGDGDFASPETLVAFALGLTLFVLTLALNVLALYIVRKYREQYE